MLRITSFGFKHGRPAYERPVTVLDCREIRNPHSLQRLRRLTGLDQEVRQYVFEDARAWHLLKQGEQAILEGRDVAFGCLGGKHRSVALAYALGETAREHGFEVEVTHRELDD